MSKVNYKLWYVKDLRLSFTKYWKECFNKTIEKVDIDDYHEVYRNTVLNSNPDDMEFLEELFDEFNIDHPEDFEERSLSTCDVVEIIRDDNNPIFYICCSFGWKQIEFEESFKKVKV